MKQLLAQPPPPQNTVITKTHLKLTTHNIQKRKDTTNAIIEQHFQTHTDILCLQEVLEKPTPPPNLGLMTFYCGATTNSNGTAILVPSYISPFTKLISTHTQKVPSLPSKSLSLDTLRLHSSAFTRHITPLSHEKWNASSTHC